MKNINPKSILDSVNEVNENSSDAKITLTDALHMLIDLHLTLLESAKKKQEILVSAEINPLLAILADESQLKRKVKQADEMRMEVLEHDKSYLPLVKLIEQQPDGKTKAELEAQLKLLKRLFEEIPKVNKLNQQLLQQSLTYTKFVIGQIIARAKGSDREEKISEDAKEYARLFEGKA
jgi:hypothetical protein